MFFSKVSIPLICTVVLCSLLVGGQSHSSEPTAADYVASPPILSTSSSPMVLLALSNDHQLYFKSYSDFDDLDSDGTVETTYTHSIDYVGYFDSYKCYSYSSGDARFNPVSVTADKYCSGNWSGNFLNWATMTRIDQIRKVLYGGYRSTDTNAHTVLERSFLVNDAHSFAKYYDGTDVERLTPYNPATQGTGAITSGMTFCNTTYAASGSSENVTAPPLLRVVEGNYSLWASGERFQCRFSDEANMSGRGGNSNNPSTSGINAYSNSPSTSDRVADLNVRVSVCVAGLEEDDCKEYPTSSHKKPVGVLQNFGDDETIQFGLLTGSYTKNKSGGVLRKNIGTFTNEVNVDSDGTFKSVPAGGGIVDTLNQMRLARYDFNDGRYNSTDSCPWGQSSFSEGTCTNWGNPFSEIVLECYRYLAGDSASSNFVTDDSTIISGLTTTTWSNPQTTDTACSQLSVVAFNASTSSYDTDQLGEVTDLNTSSSAETLTNTVGTLEGVDGNNYFVGEVIGGVQDQLCTPKTVSSLGNVKGTCPDSPRLEGGYGSAGMAYHVYQTDIRPDLPGNQLVNTYAVSLAPAIPSADIPVPSSTREIRLLPACRNTSLSPDANCAIVDFKVLQLPAESGGVVTAAYYVNWEDSEQGGDYDQDMHGVIGVSVTSSSVTVTTNVIGQSTPNHMGFGYVISGTTADGFYAQSGINGYSESDCGGGCNQGDSAASKTFSVGSTSASLLESPLFYTAKYGGFNDIDGDGTPDSDSEWDVKDVSGNYSPDGLPDNYFPVTNPLQLASALEQVFSDIGKNVASSSAAAVVANSSTGVGAVYQGLYYPTYEASIGDSIKWGGLLHGIFRDEKGHLREDTNGNDQLDGYATDYIVDIYYDSVREETRVARYTSSDDGETLASVDIVELEDFGSIWNARDQLAGLSDAEVRTQRTYSSSAANGRYIFTGIDADNSGRVDGSEIFAFTAAQFPADISNNRFRYLGLNSTTFASAPDIVDFIRGSENISGYRSRAVDYDGDDVEEVWRLGDLIHSEPAVVARPNAGYDSRFSDETYKAFRKQYENRRQVIYVGGNDGMLHAFNGGFYDFDTSSFKTKPDGSSLTEHPLGSELWAYVPMAVLPHLQWLTAPDYEHIYYVDGSPRIYDVNIFTPDDDHPHGWGTILVMGLRLGGGAYSLDPNSDDAGSDADNDNVIVQSSFIVMDITNPESPPELIAEISYLPDGLASVSLTSAGHSFTSAPSVTVAGDGSGAVASATLASEGKLLSVDISAGGTGYAVGDSLLVSGDGAGATAEVLAVDGAGEITAISVTDPGNAYSSITIDASAVGNGDASLSGIIGYSIASIEVDSAGSGYTNATISISGDGAAASAVANIFSATGFGYTTSKPVVVKQRQAGSNGSFNSPSVNNWGLLLGSGPSGSNALSDLTSDDNAKLLLFDLVARDFVTGFRPDTDSSNTNPDYELYSHDNSYIGDLASVDWDRDYSDDAVYFGTVSGTESAPDGSLQRLSLGSSFAGADLATVIDTDNPIVSAPRMVVDGFGNRWVYVGTGRYLSIDDNSSTDNQYFYGVIESDPFSTLSASDLIDVTDIQVFTEDPDDFNTVNYVRSCEAPCSGGGADVVLNGVTVSNWQQLRTELLKTNGWYRELTLDESLVNSGASRSFGPSNLVGSTLLFVEYAPSTDQCDPVGYSQINGVHFQTGTASPFARLGVSNSTYNGADLADISDDAINNLLLLGGDGQGDQDNANGDGAYTTDKGEFGNTDLGDVPYPFGRQSWQEIQVNWDIGL